jgi:serine/threonine-protein kinase
MGTVFKAYDERLDRSLAIKVIRHDAMDRPEEMERVQREARAIAAVNHPYLVQIYDLVTWEDGYGLAMELVEGVTLTHLLRQGPLAVEAAVRILSEVAEGLAAIHERGILHRDLKSQNVMVTPHGHVKIMDFGLAGVMESDSVSSDGIRGTPSTMSPEAVMGLALDARSELFSLGVLAYEILTGERPFQSRSTLGTLKSILQEHQVPVLERRQEVSQELSDLVDRLLEKKPSDRPANARVVLEVLRGLLPEGSGGTLSITYVEADPWTDRSGTGSVTSLDVTGAAALDASAGFGWPSLMQWLRLAYYRIRPTAAYRRHAVLVDRSFVEQMSAAEERELSALEEMFDRLEKPGLRAIRDDLLHLRDELRARKASH